MHAACQDNGLTKQWLGGKGGMLIKALGSFCRAIAAAGKRKTPLEGMSGAFGPRPKP